MSYVLKTPITLADAPGLFTGSEEPLIRQLMRTCILDESGKPVGEKIDQMPIKDAMHFSKLIVEASGLGVGNDPA